MCEVIGGTSNKCAESALRAAQNTFSKAPEAAVVHVSREEWDMCLVLWGGTTGHDSLIQATLTALGNEEINLEESFLTM